MKLGNLVSYVGASIFPFDMLFDEHMSITDPNDVTKCDAILLWGGEDIASSYYNQPAHPYNQNKSGMPSMRDQREWEAMTLARHHQIPIIGVCRGAQFMCAFAGGRLIQHVNNHHNTHDVMVENPDGSRKVYQTSSCHHQMMDVRDLDEDHAVVLAWASGLSSVYEDFYGPVEAPEGKKFITEPEAIYFPKIKGFAIQGHPEWMEKKDGYVKWCMDQIANLLLTERVE